MEIELNRLSAVETPVHGELRLSDDPGGSLAADGIRLPEPFRLDGGVRLDRGHAVVRGHVQGVLELECGRCLATVRQPIDLEFEARYAEASAAPRPEAPPARVTPGHGDWEGDEGFDLELVRDDLDVSFLPQGSTALRIEDVVREQVMLEVPLRPLCSEGCRGLCSRCGADKNRGTCGCPVEEFHDLRLAGLADIKKRLEGDSGPKTKS